MDFSNLGEISKIGGGLLAIAVVIYIGVMALRKESKFTEEYTNLLDQYRVRNEELQHQLDASNERHEREINELKVKHATEMQLLRAQVSELQNEVAVLKNIWKDKS